MGIPAQRRDVIDHQTATATQQVNHLSSRQEAEFQSTPARIQDDVIEDEQVGVHRLKSADDVSREVIRFEVEQRCV
jgi:hypothetical protein